MSQIDLQTGRRKAGRLWADTMSGTDHKERVALIVFLTDADIAILSVVIAVGVNRINVY